MEDDYVVLKLDSTYPGEMAQMVESIDPTIAVVQHIDCVQSAAFASCDEYCKEQAVLVGYLSPGNLLVLNNDDDRSRALAEHARAGVQVRMVGIDSFGADVLAFNVKVGLERIGFDLRVNDERYVGRWSMMRGKHLLYAELAAIAVGLHAEVSADEALRTLTGVKSLPGRMALLTGKHGINLVDDTYAAAYDSTMAALDWLQEVKADGYRTIFVMGDLDDLGNQSRYAHRTIGQRAAVIADVIIAQGVESSLVARAAIDSGKDPATVRVTYSAQDTVTALESFSLNEEDVVLVKGGSAARMEDVVSALLEHEKDRNQLVRQNLIASRAIRAPLLRPSWIEIDAAQLGTNMRIIRQGINPQVAVMAVVKADAYGHGALLAARTLAANGADYLAVANMGEALELREAGIDTPILVLSHAPVDTVRQALRQNIALSVFDMEQARMYDRAAHELGGRLKYHLKIDTGMGRLGFMADEAVLQYRYLNAFKNLELEGVFTHFSSADDDPDYTASQVDLFQRVLRPLRASGIQVKYIHAANSPGTIGNPEHHFTMVRPGIMLYGLRPAPHIALPEGVEPVLSWKTTVLQVRTFPDGYPIGYNNTYYTKGEERIAILPVGYADGLRRAPATWQYVLIHGKRAPLVGRVSMEKCAVNVTQISSVSPGDEVVLIGRQGSETISADLVAEWLETSNYEVVTTVLPRVPRS
jgi:alanine racemase